jgi:LruC domain-containing protein
MKRVYFNTGTLVLLAAVILFSVSCRKITNDPAVSTDIYQMNVSPDFKFSTTNNVGIRIQTLDNQGAAVPGIPVTVYTDIPENGGQQILSGISDANGVFSSDYKIAAGVDSLAIGTTALGFCNMQKVKVESGLLSLTLGGKQSVQQFKSGEKGIFKSTNSVFQPLGTYNSNGVPSYLTMPNDVVDAAMLQDINATLPEYIAAPTSHPQYFASANEHNLVLNDACNVWVTFVSEGAGYRNVLGFYTYNTNNPPASVAAIDTVHIIFPNASFSGSGGGLASGNRVHLGIYPPGTEIGWVLIADGFRNGTVTNGNWIVYSDKNLNPEAAADKKQHTILCNDIGRGKFLLSFEDIRRDGSCDNDFNDAIFYVTADPIQAVQTQNIPLPNYTSTDTDQDGVSNAFDAYPNDPGKAFDNYYPAKNTLGTLAFEDLWPSHGDYDFNDMVIDYNFNQITNGQNKVTQIQLKATLKAIGASYHNAFGIQLPIPPSAIASVTGTDIRKNYVVLNSNGTEAGQSKATIIVFDDGFSLLPWPGPPSVGVNTTPGATYVQPTEQTITINLVSPVALGNMGLPPYNPFMIINGERQREVHLIDNPPTDKADMSLLGTGNDKSNPASGKYYVTSGNLPYAIDISSHFDYPVEKIQVTEAHLKFFPWGESSGSQYYDWYTPKANYRDTQKIYSHQ